MSKPSLHVLVGSNKKNVKNSVLFPKYRYRNSISITHGPIL